LFPTDYLYDPGWHAKPVEEREKELSSRTPEFSKMEPERRRRILENAAKKYGKSAPPPSPPPKEGLIEGVGKDLSIGFRSGVADLERGISKAAGTVHATGIQERFEKLGKDLQPSEEETRGRSGVLNKVIQGIGSAPAAIAKYAPAELAGKYAPLAAGAIGALTSEDQSIEGRLKSGAKDVITFGAMGQAAKLPSRAKRAAGSAAAAGATSLAFSGGDVKEATASAIMGGGFGAIGGEGKHRGSLTPEKARTIMEGGVESVSAARDIIRKSVAPQNRGPEAAKMARIVRANVTDIYRQADIADYALQNATKAFSKMSDDQRLEIIHLDETGKKNPDAKVQGFVDTMREIHNGVRKELIDEASVRDPKTGEMKPTALKTVVDALNGPDEALKAYYENYWPHIFTDPKKGAEVTQGYYAGKKPLGGPATFLHQRTHPTIEDALWKHGEDGKLLIDDHGERIPTGLKLVTTDPVALYMLKWREMKRFTSAQKIIKEMGTAGLGEVVPYGKKGPAGWVEIKDDAFAKSAREPDGSKKIVGKYWAPEGAARVLNNYLSPGLRKYAGYRGMMTFNNVLNQAQLGWSGYHLGFTAVNSVMSKVALGFEQIADGKPFQGAKNIAKGTVGAPLALLETTKLGMDMRREWRNPGSSKNPETAQLVSMMEQAGGRMSLDPIYRTHMADKVNEVFRTHENYWSLAYKVPLAVTEKVSSLLMGHFVPLQKMGVFADLAKFELSKLPEGFTSDQARGAYQKAWDSIDNRFGMMVYDNLFWDKAVKDLAMASFRSVGWNLGTLREIGGGMVDTGKYLKDFGTGKHKEFTHRMSYSIAMPVVAGLMGGVIHYLYNGTRPKTLQDYYFPSVGRKDEFGRDERISIPSYMKDVWHVAQGVQDMSEGLGGGKLASIVSGKIHPGLALTADLLNNRDYYNTEIASPDDPFLKRAYEYTKFIAKDMAPFSARNIAKMVHEGMPQAEIAGTMIGLVPAPADLKKTSAERLATELQGKRLPQASSTIAQREKQVARRELERQMRAGGKWQQVAQQGINDGTLTEDDLVYSANRAVGLPLDRTFKRMQIADAIKVYNVGNADEKGRLWPILKDRIENNPQQVQNAMGRMDAAQKKKFAAALLEILQSPPPSPPPGQ
jgi:hypothetical protein